MIVSMPRPLPCALAIGGLDPGGGAGIAADLRAFAAAGVFGCAVVAVMTVQSTSGLRSATAVPASRVLAQAREVMRHQDIRAIKIGALGSASNVRRVGDWLAIHRDVPAIVDTPMIPTRGGARLLAERAVDAVRRSLVPRAALVTVNIAEAEALLGTRVTSLADARRAAIALVRMGAQAALVKGGHLVVGANATDVLAVGDVVLELRAKRLKLPPVHGAGCTLASLIAGRVAARGWSIDAVKWAKRAHHRALSNVRDVGGDLRVILF